jgi:hypothetical protein
MSQIDNPLRGDGLADILERVLDKGIVVAGDISISLVGIELRSRNRAWHQLVGQRSDAIGQGGIA